MKVTLCIPRPSVTLEMGQVVRSSAVYHFNLRWTTHHSASHYGLGVLLDQRNEVFDGFMFQHLRESVGAWLESDDLERVRGAMGLSVDERLGRQP